MSASGWRSSVAALALALAWSGQATGQVRNWPSESPPRPLAARDVRFPPYELKTLENGLQVVVVMHHEQPAVSVRLLLRAGAAYDPPGRQGTAALVAALLSQGTGAQSAREIADAIDSVGGTIDTAAGRDLTYLHVFVLKDTFDLGMRLLADMARNPAFAPEEIERQRQQVLAALQVSQEDPEYMANITFDRLVYGFHPYGFPSNGTAESVGRITRDDVAAYHRAFFAPNNAILAIVGDVTVDDAMALAEKAFGDWERRAVDVPEAPAPPSPTRRVVVLDKPDAVQTEIRVGHLGVPRKARDYMPLDLTIRILGGEGSNRLHRVLRSERGLTYGAEAQMETLLQAGEFAATTATRSETTGEALRLIVDEFYRIRRESVHERELADAKAYLTGHFPLTIETPEDIAMQVLDVLFYDLPLRELETYRQRVNAVDVEDVARVALGYLKPDRLSIVLVGNASAFVDQLRGVGFGKYEVIPLSELDLTRPDLRSPASAGERVLPRHPATGPAVDVSGPGARDAGTHTMPLARPRSAGGT